ncbi:hypothetical protein [Streptacidiphilus sp. PAMC 29251]
MKFAVLTVHAVPVVAVTHCGAEEFHSLFCSVYSPPARLSEPCG